MVNPTCSETICNLKKFKKNGFRVIKSVYTKLKTHDRSYKNDLTRANEWGKMEKSGFGCPSSSAGPASFEGELISSSSLRFTSCHSSRLFSIIITTPRPPRAANYALLLPTNTFTPQHFRLKKWNKSGISTEKIPLCLSLTFSS